MSIGAGIEGLKYVSITTQHTHTSHNPICISPPAKTHAHTSHTRLVSLVIFYVHTYGRDFL